MACRRPLAFLILMAGAVLLGGPAIAAERVEEGRSWWKRLFVPDENVKVAGDSPVAAAQPEDAPGYRIDTGDLVSVTVFGEPDLSVSQARVGGDGTISFPLIGEIALRGLSAQELKALVTARLADGYLKKPNVRVSIDKYRLYYIRGEVRRPGGYNFVDGLTVQKAIALAGGLTLRASENKITLLREKKPDRPMKSVKPNTAVFPGDVIMVGESFF